MAAGLGFKTFATGDVLTAGDTNGYLMQGVLVFASAAARDSAITSPQEGQFAYLKDTNVTTYYTGSAWANLDTTGMTNPMTTTGDTIYSSSGSTPARLGIGSTGQVLTVAGGVPSWATPSGGGGKVLQVVQASYSTATTIASTTFTDTGLSLSITPTLNTSKILVIVNQSTYIQRDSAESSSGLQIVRGATTIFTLPSAASAGVRYIGVGGQSFVANGGIDAMTYLDSPATTSATTYKTQAKIQASSSNGLVTAQPSSIPSVITLLEIGA